ncbi:MAG TPA: hypothetical protein VIF62_34645 [Labilithrix sp.]
MAMRSGWLGLVVSVLGLVACGSGDEGAMLHPGAAAPGGAGGGAASGGGAAPGATTDDPSTPASACPASVPAPRLLATDGNAADLRIVSGMIWFRANTDVVTMAKDGTGRATKYTSQALVRTYVETEAMLHVESPNPPDAVLVRTSLDGKVLAQAAEPWIAAGTRVFGDDGDYYYVVAEVENGVGDTVFRVSKTTLAAQALANFGEGDENAIAYPQLAYPNIWFVRGQKRAYEVTQLAQTDDNGDVIGLAPQPATEIFASATDDCRLAVDSKSAYCSNGTALVKRDLLGANPTTILDETMSAVKAAIGAPVATEDALAVLPDASARTVIRMLVSGKESIAACGRDGISEVAVDAQSVVWAETGTSSGLYLAPR